MKVKADLDRGLTALIQADAIDAGGLSALANRMASNSLSLTTQAYQYINSVLQYNGLRDIFTSAGWKDAGTTAAQVAAMGPFYYKRVGAATALISKPPAWSWRRGFALESDSAGWNEAAKSAVNAFQLSSKLARADELSRVGRYGLLVLDYEDTATNPGATGAWATPAPLTRPIYAANPYMEAAVTSIKRGPDGLLRYTITFTNTYDGETTTPTEVHASRVIHVADNTQESSFYGTPVIMDVLNELDDLIKVSGSAGEAFYRYRGTYILQQIQDKDGVPIGFEDDTQGTELLNKFKAYYLGLYSTMLLSNVEPKQIADPPQDPKAWQDTILERIAIAKGWPKRILQGSETGERSSTEDMKLWAAMIESRQLNHVAPNIVRPLVDRLILSHQIPDPGATGYRVTWPSVLVPTEEDLTDKAKAMSQINKEHLLSGAVVFTPEEIRETMGLAANV